MVRKNPPVAVQLDKKKLDYIRERLVHEFNPLKIILFGSRAEGRATEESDIDLLILLCDAITDHMLRFKVKNQLSAAIGLYVQLIFMPEHLYQETRDVIGGIAYPAAKYGVVIYEKP